MKTILGILLFLLLLLLFAIVGAELAGIFALLDKAYFYPAILGMLLLLPVFPFLPPFRKYFYLYLPLLLLLPGKKILFLLGLLPWALAGLLHGVSSRKKRVLLLLFLVFGILAGQYPPLRELNQKYVLSHLVFPKTQEQKKAAPLFASPDASLYGACKLASAICLLQLPDDTASPPSLLLSHPGESAERKGILTELFDHFLCKDIEYTTRSFAGAKPVLKGNYSLIFFQPDRKETFFFYTLHDLSSWQERKKLLAGGAVHALFLPPHLSRGEQKKLLSKIIRHPLSIYKYNLLFPLDSSYLLLSSDSPLTGERKLLEKLFRDKYSFLHHSGYPPGVFMLYMASDGFSPAEKLSSPAAGKQGLFPMKEWGLPLFPEKIFLQEGKWFFLAGGGLLLLLLLPVFYFIFRYFHSGKGENKIYFHLFESTFFLTALPLFLLLPEKSFTGHDFHNMIFYLLYSGGFFLLAYANSPGETSFAPIRQRQFSLRTHIPYGVCFCLLMLGIHFSLHAGKSFLPLFTCLLLPGAFLTFAGVFYGWQFGLLMECFPGGKETEKQLIALPGAGALAGITFTHFFYIFVPEGGIAKILFLLLLAIFSFPLYNQKTALNTGKGSI